MSGINFKGAFDSLDLDQDTLKTLLGLLAGNGAMGSSGGMMGGGGLMGANKGMFPGIVPQGILRLLMQKYGQ